MRTNARFNICPLEPWAAKLALYRHNGSAKPRVPIGERALARRIGNPISFERALSFEGLSFFPLEGNQFIVNDPRGPELKVIRARAIEHFGSAVKDSLILLKLEGDGQKSCGVNLKLFPKEPDADRSSPFLSWSFNINFVSKSIFGQEIRSKRPGLAGGLLEARYNFARDLGIEKIEFRVMPENIDAMRFFYHMDLGRPNIIDGNMDTTWRLEL